MANCVPPDGPGCPTDCTAPRGFRRADAAPRRAAARRESDPALGTWLGMNPFRVSRECGAYICAIVRETLTLYAEEGLVHPGTILHIGNWVLRHNVVLGPWMHVGSTEHFAAARIGDELTARADHRQLRT